MEGRVDISAKIANIKNLSVNLLKEMLPIMKQLVNEDNDLTDEVLHNLDLPKDKESEVNTWLQNYCDNLIEDANSIKNEADKFVTAYRKGDEVIDKNIAEYPFLAEVWYGDTYGESGVHGLDMLIADLEKDLQKATETKIINEACKQKF